MITAVKEAETRNLFAEMLESRSGGFPHLILVLIASFKNPKMRTY
jgi:hypothetical protein